MNDATEKQFPPVPVAENYNATITVWCEFSIETEPKKIKLAETRLSESSAGVGVTGLSFQNFINEHLDILRIYYEDYPDGEITIEVAQTVNL